MLLDFNTIIPAICGCAKIFEENGKLYLYRFTDEQTEAYRAYSSDFYKKTKATAGVRLEFLTDSEDLTLCGEAVSASSRNFFAFDVYVDGNFTAMMMPPADQRLEYESACQFKLHDGALHEIMLHFRPKLSYISF